MLPDSWLSTIAGATRAASNAGYNPNSSPVNIIVIEGFYDLIMMSGSLEEAA
jgi:hypothetical protein